MAKSVKNKVKKKSAAGVFSMKILGNARSLAVFSFPYVISLTLLGILFGAVVVYAMNSPTFELQEVKILNTGSLTPEQAFQFCELKRGENLPTLNLVNVQQVIKRRHPEFREVIVRRVLPNRIEVLLKRRTPAAQVAFSRFLQIDRDLVILPGSSPVPFRNLTVIQGSPVPQEGFFVGVTLRDNVTKKALVLAEMIHELRSLKDHRLTKIDVTDPKNIALTVDDAIEVRIGGNHFRDRLKILDETLKSVALDPLKVKYIDLRFDDVVIGPRSEKKGK